MSLGLLSFVSPWLLLGLAALPALWWLLRLTPPSPRRQRFPAISLLFELRPREETPYRTPLWLILLRIVLAVLVILGFADPLINAGGGIAGLRALAIVIDDDWAAAPSWADRQGRMDEAINEAERANIPVLLLPTAPPAGGGPVTAIGLLTAAEARQKIRALEPMPWAADRAGALAAIDRAALPKGLAGDMAVLWVTDGLADSDRGATMRFIERLKELGSLSVIADGPANLPLLLRPPEVAPTGLILKVERAGAGLPQQATLRALDDAGRLLSRETVSFAADATTAKHELKLPTELRNRIASLALEGAGSAGSVLLMDDRWRQRPVGIVSGTEDANGQPLLSETFYVERALAPYAELRHGDFETLLQRELSVLIMADIGAVPEAEAARLKTWIDKGGVLLRFAGPRLAQNADNLLPVRLRGGDRQLGGAMSWSQPARLAPFPAESPFAGLPIPSDVLIQRQVLAEPEIDLGKKTWARLTDGTPLVTAAKQGNGWIVLVHTTANTSWSNLALSGLFVEMLQRLTALGQGVYGGQSRDPLPPLQTLDGFGRMVQPPPTALPLLPADIAANAVGPRHPPGYYGKATARQALNLGSALPPLAPLGAMPAGVTLNPVAGTETLDLEPWLLGGALLLLLIDLVIALALRGLLAGWRRPAAAVLALLMLLPAMARAQNDDPEKFALDAAGTTRLAYVITGNDENDSISKAGLYGLTLIVSQRTAADLGAPMGLDIEKDELAFFPLLYWRVPPDAAPLSDNAVQRLTYYLKHGGMILFDTADQLGLNGSNQGLGRMLRDMDVPPLIPAPPDHVLTKAFYLLRDFPGRYDGGILWVEQGEGRVNDGVSGVIIGANDWAGAWAVDENGQPLYATVPGGDRQRELAYRFGINLVMYALTGNYKSDQVHVPAILERLGQ